ncbi:hypothetical protein [Endozoicomonas sp. 4G]|uniref:hypothetical protein n=1 Tax=Endozoicomonas sp. 4G TaxID=2872754 RepID=UPI0020786DEB|nr:hypothetical protein [Endozoicomonas sp. 4G]
MKSFICALFITGLSNLGVASCLVYESSNSWKTIGYIGSDGRTIYKLSDRLLNNVYLDRLKNFAFELTNKLGYGIFLKIFYETPHQEEVIGYISIFRKIIYENAASWNEVGFIGWDGSTIYKNRDSWNIVGYIGFGCDDD